MPTRAEATTPTRAEATTPTPAEATLPTPARTGRLRPVACLALGLALGWVACAGAPPPRDRFHRLSVPPPAAGELELSGTVEVERLRASPLLRQRPVVFRRASEPDVLDQHDHHFWDDGPPVLLQQALVAGLRASGIADAVAGSELRAPADWRVGGHVLRFERVLAGSDTTVDVAIELTLRRPRGRDLDVHRLYEVTRSAGGAAVEDSVAAFAAATAEIVERFLADVRESQP